MLYPSEPVLKLKILPGQYYDQETGLHYNYFRDYDPSTGRYIESDPIGLDGGSNTYIYVVQNPINYLDLKALFGVNPSKIGEQKLPNGGKEYGGIECDGNGKFVIKVYVPKGHCLYNCAYKHEQIHINDILIKRDENVCRRQKPGVRVKPDDNEFIWTERRGYLTELDCLDATINDCDNCKKERLGRWINIKRILSLL